jgi:hypothetical protein
MPQTAMGKEVTLNRALTVSVEPYLLRVCYGLPRCDVLCIASHVTEESGACAV